MAVTRREYNDENGKPVWGYAFSFRHRRYRKAGFLTKREAEYAEQVMRKTVMIDGKSPTASKRIKFADIVAEFFENRQTERAITTVIAEQGKISAVVRFFGKRMVDEISAGDVLAFRTSLNKSGLANRSVNLYLTFVRSIFQFAVLKGYATNNPATSVKNLPETITDHPLLPEEKYNKFLEEAGRTRTGVQLVFWIMLRALTGLRPTESLFLQWQDVDLQNDQIYVRPNPSSAIKRRRFRVVEIHSALKPLLLEWKKRWEETMVPIGTPHQWLFYHPRYPEQRAKGFQTAFENARKNAGVPEFRPYDLRHYFISTAIMSGVDTFTISKWVGHASTHMIEKVYGHLTPEHRAKQMGRINFDIGNPQPNPAPEVLVEAVAVASPQPA